MIPAMAVSGGTFLRLLRAMVFEKVEGSTCSLSYRGYR